MLLEGNKKVYLVAITGVVGSGKTTVSNILRRLDYYVFDVDIFSRRILEENKKVIEVIEKIVGECVTINRKIDYKKVGKIFDENPKLEDKFELWYQPFLGGKLIEEVLSFDEKYQIIFFDIPLLEKKCISHIFDCIWIINSKEAEYYNRVKNRNNYSNEKIKRLIESSQTCEDIISLNTKVIKNNSSIEELKKRINFECICLEEIFKKIDNNG
ncbi:dephospho-CoA kinase [Clostridium perfringens]|nr:dephospho-CoA kinase [Clostridium perfringens]